MRKITKKQGIIGLCVLVPVGAAITFFMKRGKR